MNVTYYQGDATDPRGPGHKLIVHVCNNIGAWGAGFVVALSSRWSSPENCYRMWAKNGVWYGQAAEQDAPFKLGETQLVPITDTEITVANCIAQNNKPSAGPGMRFRPQAFRACLRAVRQEAFRLDASVHMPRVGTGIGGASWDLDVLPCIKLILPDVPVLVYDL